MLGGVLLFVVWGALLGQPSTRFAEAQAAFDELQFEKALKLAPPPAQWKGLSRSEVVQVLSVRALSLASIKRDDEASLAFRQLLSVEPGFVLPEQFGPRVRTVFLEARDAAQRAGGLTLKASDGTLSLSGNAAGLAEQVRVGWAGTSTTVTPERLSQPPWPPETKEVWAVVLGPGASVLLEWGSPEQPRPLRAASALPPPPPPPPVAAPTSALRTVGLVTGIVGVAGMVGGAVALALAGRPAEALSGVARDDQGRVTSLTQRDAFALDAAANTAWQAGGGLLIGGAIALVTGAALFFVGSAQVAAGPGGVAVLVPLDATFLPGAAR